MVQKLPTCGEANTSQVPGNQRCSPIVICDYYHHCHDFLCVKYLHKMTAPILDWGGALQTRTAPRASVSSMQTPVPLDITRPVGKSEWDALEEKQVCLLHSCPTFTCRNVKKPSRVRTVTYKLPLLVWENQWTLGNSFSINHAHNTCEHYIISPLNHHQKKKREKEKQIPHKTFKSLEPQPNVKKWNLYFISFPQENDCAVQIKLLCHEEAAQRLQRREQKYKRHSLYERKKRTFIH